MNGQNPEEANRVQHKKPVKPCQDPEALPKGGINATGLAGSKEELRAKSERFMIKLLHLPQHVRSYFQHSCVQYAAGV
jgi:hypothetical protein